ncbi:MAG: response regulator [Parasporobacterium sp.]|nr:response regulator [Parasporobacterium sp.]
MTDRKWQVLIADDEPKVCELIKYLIPWDELGLELAAAAGNGLEAIEVLKNRKVDILITDARMPECDGIELIKWCSQNKPGIKSIVISGYRNFEYAHGALKYGVNSYLLKPINRKELEESLSEIIEELRGEEREVQNSNELQKIMSRNRDTLRNHFISSYVFDGYQYSRIKSGLVDDINSEYQMNFRDETYRAIFIKLDHDPELDAPMDRLLNIVKKNTEELMTGFAYESVSVKAHSGVIHLLNYGMNLEAEFRSKMDELYADLEKTLDAYDRTHLTIGVGVRGNSLSEIGRCIAMAGEAVKFRVDNPGKKVIFYEDYEYKICHYDHIVSMERRRVLESHTKHGNISDIGKVIDECRMQVAAIGNMSPAVLYAVINEIGQIPLSVTESILEDKAIIAEIRTGFEERIDCTVSKEGLWNCVRETYEKCVGAILSEMANQQTKPVRLLKTYIEEHYGEPISLESAAEYVKLSPNYVSTIFKKETGVSFLEYLTTARLDAATEMLRKTDMSINEIAEKVGYADVKYFSKLCRKTLGMKPSEYRKLYS